MERNGFHAFIGKRNRRIGCIGNFHGLQRILKTHQAKTDRTMAQVRKAGFGDGIEIDVDHVIKHTHGGFDRFGKLVVIKAIFRHMRRKIDRAKVTHRNFIM